MGLWSASVADSIPAPFQRALRIHTDHIMAEVRLRDEVHARCPVFCGALPDVSGRAPGKESVCVDLRASHGAVHDRIGVVGIPDLIVPFIDGVSFGREEKPPADPAVDRALHVADHIGSVVM